MEITKHELCCGCGLCENVCPVAAIEFVSDAAGFLYPKVNEKKCIKCGACVKNCVVNNPPVIETHNLEGFSYSIGTKDIMKSASGGAAFMFGRSVIEQGGIVYGVAYTDDFCKATYLRAETLDELEKTRDTKYFHAENDKVLFSNIEKDLQEDRIVLFVGLPCEVAAVRKRLGHKYERLLLIDIFCHGVTSVKAHAKMIYELERKEGQKILKYSVKDKKNGWSTQPDLVAEFSNGRVHRERFYTSDFAYVFVHMARLSCYQCHFKDNSRTGDISIGDFWGIKDKDPGYNKDGVSAIIINTDKGKQFVDLLKDKINLYPEDAEYILDNNPWTRKSIPLGDRMEYEEKFCTHEEIYVPFKERMKKRIKALRKHR